MRYESDIPGIVQELKGTIERITYHNEESGYTVLRVLLDGEKKPMTAVGKFMQPNEGEYLLMSGEWTDNPRYGRQFTFESAVRYVPSSLEGLKKFLGSGLIKGLGEKMADRIIERFGEETVAILDANPERLREIPGIGSKTVERIRDGWLQKRNVQEVMSFLQGHGITPRLAEKIHKFYGARTLGVVKDNPYLMARDIDGVGFRRADKIAREMGFEHDAPERADAAVLYLLDEASGAGHCFLHFQDLKMRGASLLGVEEDAVEAATIRLYKDEDLHCEKIFLANGDEADAVYSNKMVRAETYVSQKLADLVKAPKILPKIDLVGSFNQFEERFHLQFAPTQKKAIEMVLKGGVSVVTGGPGTGKTTLVRAIIHLLKEHGARVLLAAPTGRAAKRLEESTKNPAKTIHRLLAYDNTTGKFFHHAGNTLKADLIVLDEVSMLDIQLAASFLRAISPSTSLLLVGDVDQLPSVGPGDFLRDVIASDVVQVTRLNEVFRQANRSLIVRNAHRINEGEFPYSPKPGEGENEDEGLKDFYIIPRDKPDEAQATLLEILRNKLPRKFKLDPFNDVQVLVPMHKNTLGASALNELMQERLNAHEEKVDLGFDRYFSRGDKVIQTKNNYDLEVFNGDVGVVSEIDRETRTMKVDFEGRYKSYDFSELDQLQLAYAITIHKSQGSEYKAVVVVLHSQHHIMLQRNLLYTAVTRGRKLVILLGSKRAIGMAISNDRTAQRNSGLAWRLKSEVLGEDTE
jgi:exodeoxyribonuclease V alpha subunit